MHPLTHRRKGTQALVFSNEYDVQDLLHALLRPWVADIRPEEFTPSYAGSSTRMDFLLPAHKLVVELKFVRDRAHAKKIGDELIVDIEHYRKHPDCQALWCVVYDPNHYLTNAEGLCSDLSGRRLVVELKFVRDRAHAKKIGDELIVDIEHYRKHPDCQALWCVVYDPNHYLTNAEGLCSDLSGRRRSQDVELETQVFVL